MESIWNPMACMASSPDDVLNRATSGDFGALREIVFRMAYGFTRSYARAEDVAQEALTKIWLRSPNWKAIENPKAWIARVVLNASRTEWRWWGRGEVVSNEGRSSQNVDELIMPHSACSSREAAGYSVFSRSC
jgi:DNA-directed RNA polymerase specialized sigma24 family protein